MTAGPIDVGERIPALDVLRGFALLGIVMVNVFSFGLPAQEAFSRPPVADPVEDTGFVLMRSLFQFKWMPIFSMLFGAGLAVQVARAAARGEGFVGRYLRRTGVLLVVGLAHAWLLWYGDILVWYAVLGVGLLAVRRTSPRTLLTAGAVLLVAGGLLAGGLGVAEAAFGGGAGDRPTERLVVDDVSANEPRGWDAITAAQFDPSRPEWIRGERIAYAEGPWRDAAAFRIVTWLYGLFMLILGWGFVAFGCFLLGAGLLRTGFFDPQRRRLQGRIAAIGIGIGLPAEILGAVLVVGGGLPAAVAGFTHGLTGPLTALGFLAGITWLVSTGRTAAWDAPVRAAGRAALSVYLGQTILGLMVFQWWGLGLFAAVPRPVMLLIAAAIWLVLTAAATLWLARFRFGPAEWVWRTATYGRWQPLRRRDAAAG